MSPAWSTPAARCSAQNAAGGALGPPFTARPCVAFFWPRAPLAWELLASALVASCSSRDIFFHCAFASFFRWRPTLPSTQCASTHHLGASLKLRGSSCSYLATTWDCPSRPSSFQCFAIDFFVVIPLPAIHQVTRRDATGSEQPLGAHGRVLFVIGATVRIVCGRAAAAPRLSSAISPAVPRARRRPRRPIRFSLFPRALPPAGHGLVCVEPLMGQRVRPCSVLCFYCCRY